MFLAQFDLVLTCICVNRYPYWPPKPRGKRLHKNNGWSQLAMDLATPQIWKENWWINQEAKVEGRHVLSVFHWVSESDGLPSLDCLAVTSLLRKKGKSTNIRLGGGSGIIKCWFESNETFLFFQNLGWWNLSRGGWTAPKLNIKSNLERKKTQTFTDWACPGKNVTSIQNRNIVRLFWLKYWTIFFCFLLKV